MLHVLVREQPHQAGEMTVVTERTIQKWWKIPVTNDGSQTDNHQPHKTALSFFNDHLPEPVTAFGGKNLFIFPSYFDTFNPVVTDWIRN